MAVLEEVNASILGGLAGEGGVTLHAIKVSVDGDPSRNTHLDALTADEHRQLLRQCIVHVDIATGEHH